MMPTVGQRVKCILRSGVMAEGIVEGWSNNSVQLRSLDDKSILIIPHPGEDIMLIKIILNEQKVAAPKIKTELEVQFNEVLSQPSDDNLRIKKMAELKALMIDQEKKMITDKLKDHRIGNIKEVKYGSPYSLPGTK